jgi:putative membrane protein
MDCPEILVGIEEMWGYGHGQGMMDGFGGMGFGIIFWIVILALVIWAVVWFVRSSPYAPGRLPPTERRSSGLEVLEERYARGEISREEYLQKQRDIAG